MSAVAGRRTPSAASDDVETTPVYAAPDLPTHDIEAHSDGSSSGDELTTTVSTRNPRAKDQRADVTEYVHSRATRLETRQGADGAITLKPLAQAGHKARTRVKRRAVDFKPRSSVFDRDSDVGRADHFRGFYTLFWLLLGMTTVRTLEKSYRSSGYIVGTRFATLFSQDAKVLALSDAVLVGTSILCVPFIKLIQHGWIRYWWTGCVIQHVAQTLYLATVVRWTFHRQWPWVQAGFLTLHALTMLMKIHSYLSTNGDLSHMAAELAAVRTKLDAAIETAGGYEKAIAVSTEEAVREGKPPLSPMPRATSLFAPSAEDAATLRQRKRSSKAGSGSSVDSRKLVVDDATRFHVLRTHPDHEIASLAARAHEVQEYLTSPGTRSVVWPANVTYANFVDYLLVPTLVYELEFPRTKAIRPLYVLEKVLATMGTFTLLYIVSEHYISPVINDTSQPFVSTMVDLAAPFLVNYCLLFFIIFECICNAFAELTRFADRGFYDDWWNATDFSEFSRKWNKPVHNFLLRHVYASTLSSTSYKVSKSQAMFVTFLLSACVHELVMVVVTKKVRMFLFMCQMAQLPLVALSKHKFFKQHPAIGNLWFWISIGSGFPLLGAAYGRTMS